MKTVELIVNVLMLVVAAILVAVVLLQDATSAGLGSVFGNDTTALGQARNQKVSKEVKLQKLTVVFAIVLAVLALILLVLPGIEALIAAQ
ncbi:MAG: preprotein translocase subunit SecG [Christensenellaceae bacterium]|nr:preprotein translocase subunit SecG [Christensenellaceae bacterium]